jgi:hypothetical protein
MTRRLRATILVATLALCAHRSPTPKRRAARGPHRVQQFADISEQQILLAAQRATASRSFRTSSRARSCSAAAAPQHCSRSGTRGNWARQCSLPRRRAWFSGRAVRRRARVPVRSSVGHRRAARSRSAPTFGPADRSAAPRLGDRCDVSWCSPIRVLRTVRRRRWTVRSRSATSRATAYNWSDVLRRRSSGQVAKHQHPRRLHRRALSATSETGHGRHAGATPAALLGDGDGPGDCAARRAKQPFLETESGAACGADRWIAPVARGPRHARNSGNAARPRRARGAIAGHQLFLPESVRRRSIVPARR